MNIWIKDCNNKIGDNVDIFGWVHSRRDHGKIIFFDIRDRSGVLQVVFSPDDIDSKYYDIAKEVRREWVVKIKGNIKERPDSMKNKKIITGNIEMQAKEIEILSKAKTLPFEIENNDGTNIGDDVRMKYRYLDIRRKRVAKNLINRNNVIYFLRKFLFEKEFIEVETPILTKSTPEGARDFLVPSRVYKGKFYALPQSPQQYKQLLMIGGIGRYFQIAKCFRDEDARGDRQPEFTQLDIEMSFVNENDILNIVQEMLISMIKKLYPEKVISTLDKNGNIPILSYKHVMDKYNTDRPDIRNDKNDKNDLAILFVKDFPMFEWKENESRWDAVHHPFTHPKLKNGSIDLNEIYKSLSEDPSSLLAQQYDVVLNGYEIGGGSLRVYNSELLLKILETMGNNYNDIKNKFGHLLEAFSYGVPPHGGIALGIDRILMVLENENTIREVMAFPKTGDGRDLMMNSPSDVYKEQLDELGIKINISKRDNI